MDNWKQVKIEDICKKVCSGGTPNRKKKEYYVGGDIPWLNTGEITFNRIRTTENYITQAGLENSSAKWIPKNTVVVAMYGASAARVGVAKIPLTTNQACCNLIIDEGKADYRYVYYWLRLQHQKLASLANGGAQQNLNAGQIKDYPIFLPKIEEQYEVANLLWALDDKIENNTKINHHLEQMAQAIFKSWFVDFEPFGGTMPSDWRKGKAENFFDISIGKTPPRKEHEWFSTDPDNIAWVSIADMGNSGIYINRSSEFLTVEAIKRFNVKVVPRGTVLLSFKLTVGRVAIADGEMATNEAIAHFKQTKDTTLEYLYCFLKAFDYQSLGNTSSIATAVNSKTIKQMPFVMPDEKTLEKFHAATSSLFEKIRVTIHENKRLAELRDTLLPRLMSGELSVSDIGDGK